MKESLSTFMKIGFVTIVLVIIWACYNSLEKVNNDYHSTITIFQTEEKP